MSQKCNEIKRKNRFYSSRFYQYLSFRATLRFLGNFPSLTYKHFRYYNIPVIKKRRIEQILKQQTHKKILFLDHKIPTPDKDSGSFRIWQLLKILSKTYYILFWPDNISEPTHYVLSLHNHRTEFISPFSRRRFLERYGKYFDLVILSRPKILKKNIAYIKTHCLNAKLIFDTVDLHYVRTHRQAVIADNPDDKDRLQKLAESYYALEISGVEQTDQTWVVAEEERKSLHDILPDADIRIIPNIHPLPVIGEKSFNDTKNILFVGGFDHHPNTDAVSFCAKEIWPLILKDIPSAKWIIIGANPPEEIRALSNQSILIKGFVPNLEPYLLGTRVFIAPLRYGAGMKGKIGQALSYGIPTVTTTIGAEGFPVTGNEMIIADKPEDFASAVVSLYTDIKMWDTYQSNSRIFMKRFTPDIVGLSLKASMEDLLNQ